MEMPLRCPRLALFCVVLGWASTATALNDGSRVSQNQFDVDAPAIAFEDIDAQNNRLGNESERQRTESLRASQACLKDKRVLATGPARAVTPTAAAGVRADLRDKSLHELALMYQRSPDPDVAVAIQIRAAEASPNAGLPARPGTTAGASPEARLLDQLSRQAGAANDATTQDCLAAADDNMADADEPLPAAFEQAAFAIRKGRAQSVVVDFVGELPGAAYLGYTRRYNVVSRSGPYRSKVMSIRQADAASRHPQGVYWPELPATPSAGAQPAPQTQKTKPALIEGLGALSEALNKLDGASK
jgi:hypothetical protein